MASIEISSYRIHYDEVRWWAGKVSWALDFFCSVSFVSLDGPASLVTTFFVVPLDNDAFFNVWLGKHRPAETPCLDRMLGRNETIRRGRSILQEAVVFQEEDSHLMVTCHIRKKETPAVLDEIG